MLFVPALPLATPTSRRGASPLPTSHSAPRRVLWASRVLSPARHRRTVLCMAGEAPASTGRTSLRPSDEERAASPQLEHVFLADLPLLPVSEVPRNPARWERVGAYAVFDDSRLLRYVGYSRNVLAKLELHAQLQRSQFKYFKAYFPPRDWKPVPDELERMLRRWIRENGGVPPGNREPEQWEVPPSPQEVEADGASATGRPSGRAYAEEEGERSGGRPRQRPSPSSRNWRARGGHAGYDESDDPEEYVDGLPRAGLFRMVSKYFTRPRLEVPPGVLADESVRVRELDAEGTLLQEYPIDRQPRRVERRVEDVSVGMPGDARHAATASRPNRRAARTAAAANRRRRDIDELLELEHPLDEWMPFLALGGLMFFLWLYTVLTNANPNLPPESLGM
ncbi:hypothetical protein CDCA_CDCA04G1433 [Cyanidium caldarium]|uniref:GIY-YIG domain-containing protein n=1 Tax=Cyanidium caldarium TaxID=2771 RepID=A0AAV9IT11_CYACA|nr:hypothetical protein CDCA_CDCA04G1433 [Cyanidium caldarium]